MEEIENSEMDVDVGGSKLTTENIHSRKKNNNKKVLSAFFIFIIFVWIIKSTAVADPDSTFLYNFKRFYEKTQLSLKSGPQDKLNYQYTLLDKRLAELIHIIEVGASPYVLTTSLRYSTTAGQITELIINNDLKDESQKAKEKLEGQLLIVEKLPGKYSGTGDEVKFIIDDINYLKTYIDMLSSFSSR